MNTSPKNITSPFQLDRFLDQVVQRLNLPDDYECSEYYYKETKESNSNYKKVSNQEEHETFRQLQNATPIEETPTECSEDSSSEDESEDDYYRKKRKKTAAPSMYKHPKKAKTIHYSLVVKAPEIMVEAKAAKGRSKQDLKKQAKKLEEEEREAKRPRRKNYFVKVYMN